MALRRLDAICFSPVGICGSFVEPTAKVSCTDVVGNVLGGRESVAGQRALLNKVSSHRNQFAQFYVSARPMTLLHSIFLFGVYGHLSILY